MKKLALTMALAAFMTTGATVTTLACDGGKCKMEHTGKSGKSKKGKKAADTEACHQVKDKATASAEKGSKSCCMKKEPAKATDKKD